MRWCGVLRLLTYINQVGDVIHQENMGKSTQMQRYLGHAE